MPQKPSSLGRGLGSLIPKRPAQDESTSGGSAAGANAIDQLIAQEEAVERRENPGQGMRRVPVDAIRPNPRQPRTDFNEDALQELADSIATHGVLQPVVVTVADDGSFEIIMGERRWRAAQRAGITDIPVIVREADDQEKLELALIENIVRENLNPIEQALAYKQYIDEFDLTHEEAAKRLGKQRTHVSNSLRILNLPQEIQKGLRDGKLTDAHAKVIVGLPNAAQQLELYRRVIDRKLTVAKTRVETQKLGGTKSARLKVDPKDEEMAKQLRQRLGTRVSIQRAGYRGKIVVEFFDYDELVDIVQKMLEEE